MLKYLFYKYYRFAIAVGNKDIAKFQGYIMLFIFLNLNIVSFLGLLSIYVSYSLSMSDWKIYVSIAIEFASLFFYIKPYKAERIIEKYKYESDHKRVLGNLFTFLYSFVSFILFPLSIYLMMLKNLSN